MVWTRRLGLAWGHDAFALLAVLVAFFGAISLGAAIGHRPVLATRRPGRWFAGMQFAIALWFVLTSWFLPKVASGVATLLGPSPHPFFQWVAVFMTAFVLLCPATLPMGGTLPALERCARLSLGHAQAAGWLYAVNTGGAVAGVLAGTFLILPAMGFRESLWLFAGCSALAGVGALFATRGESTASPQPPTGSSGPRLIGGVQMGLVGWGAGWLGMGVELLGTRLLGQITEGTIYSFALVLSVFLLGTTLGAALERRTMASVVEGTRLNAMVDMLALLTMLALALTFLAPSVIAHVEPKAGTHLAELGVAGMVFGPPTLVMGALFSLLARNAARAGQLGSLVCLNALGAAMAPLVFGIGLVPSLGAKTSWGLIAAAYPLLAGRFRPRAIVVALIAVLVVFLLPPLSGLLDLPRGSRVESYREGAAGTVAVIGMPDGQRVLRVDGRFTMGGTASAAAERRHAHLPLLLHPAPHRVLLLGTGTGITSGATLAHPDLAGDTVELVPEVAAALPDFARESGFERWAGRLQLWCADARRFVTTTTNRYDVVVADLFHPGRDGAGGLYTVEHFAALKSRLAPGGLCCQWLPLYQLNERTLRCIVRSYLAVFPEPHAFLLRLNVDTPVLGLIASTSPLRYPADWLARRVKDAELRLALQPLALTDTVSLLGLFVAGPEALSTYSQGAPLNTDDRPVVTFSAPTRNPRTDPMIGRQVSQWLAGLREDHDELVEPDAAGREVARRLDAYGAARNRYLEGLEAERAGRTALAMQLYLESVRLSPDFSTGYAHCLTLAMQQSKEKPEAARRLLEQLRDLHPQRSAAGELLRRLGESPKP